MRAEPEPTIDTPQTKPAEDPTSTPAMGEQISGITLTAEAKGNRRVLLRWEVSETVATEAEGYRIVQGKAENPTWPSPYWFERGPAHREKEMTGLPLGKQHFRVCVVKNRQCMVYSNNVEVEVK